MKQIHEHAVSPVVGVMLMLVVTIIVAAVVSAFAGGVTSSQNKPYQATIKGAFSVSDGMRIVHGGGDTLPTSGIVFSIYDGPTFGVNVQQQSTQILDMHNVTDVNGNPVKFSDGTFNITSFRPGDTLYINTSQSSCKNLQPLIAPHSRSGPYGGDWNADGWSWNNALNPFWKLCLRNPDNVGKTFTLTVSDMRGNVISSSDITITG